MYKRRASDFSSGRAASRLSAALLAIVILVTGCESGDKDPAPGSGSPGQIVEAGDGRQLWTTSALPPLDDIGLQTIECVGQATCVVAGYRTQPGGGSTIGSAILASHDSGATWTISTLPSDSNRANVRDIACADEVRCVGVFGIVKGRVLVTTDGGMSWEYRDAPPDSTMDVVSCVGSDCLAVGSSGYPGPVETFASSDAGSTWNRSGSPDVDAFGVFSLTCPTADRCYLITSADDDDRFRLFVTDDRGHNWTDRTPEGQLIIDHVDCSDELTCLVGGVPSLSLTTDGGTHWTRGVRTSFEDSIGSISCGADSFCVAVGAGGIASSRNGGQTWQSNALPGGLTSMLSVSCALPSGCVAVGQNKVEFEYSPGQTSHRYEGVILTRPVE